MNFTLHKAQKRLKLYSKASIYTRIFIVPDVNMPEIDDRTCLRELKRGGETKDIPVVIFSTSSEQYNIEETKSLRATDFMAKASISDLTANLDNFLKYHSKNKSNKDEE